MTADEVLADMIQRGHHYAADHLPCSLSALRAAAKRHGGYRIWQTTDRQPWGKIRKVYAVRISS